MTIKVFPNSAKNIVDVKSDRLEVRLTAAPVDGKANSGLLKLLGKKLKVPQSSMAIVRGASSREKVIFVPGIDANGVCDALGFR